MYYYALLNQSGVCIGISSLTSLVDRDDHVLLEGYDEDYMYRKYENGEWSGEKFLPEAPAIELNRIEKLEQENIELKIALAEMTEANEQEKTEMQLAIAELAELVGGEING